MVVHRGCVDNLELFCGSFHGASFWWPRPCFVGGLLLPEVMEKLLELRCPILLNLLLSCFATVAVTGGTAAMLLVASRVSQFKRRGKIRQGSEHSWTLNPKPYINPKTWVFLIEVPSWALSHRLQGVVSRRV